MPGRIWVDVEDVFEAAAFNRRPTGIQRVQSEICRALVALDPAGERVGFVRHDPARQSFRVIPWRELEAVFTILQSGVAEMPSRPDILENESSAARNVLRRMAHRLPARIRQPVFQYLVHQREALRSLGDLRRASFQRPVHRPKLMSAEGSDFGATARPGDTLIVLGAIWYHPDYANLIQRAQQALGVSFAVLLYDVIPLRGPEWCERGHARLFREWFAATVGLADRVFTISQSSARDIARSAAELGITLRAPAEVVPMGSGFDKSGDHLPGDKRPVPAEAYVLTVATLEARKNHASLFRIWRRMLDEMPREKVPTLVFAGRVGWMVGDLLQQLRNSRFLGGKILLWEDATDAELEDLYRGCLFTLFPSYYEGWGLPVTESLSFGRPCIASSAASLPEAGGALARYFDPDNVTEAYNLVRAMLADPEGLASWRARIAAEFRPVPWTDAAAALLASLQAA